MLNFTLLSYDNLMNYYKLYNLAFYNFVRFNVKYT